LKSHGYRVDTALDGDAAYRALAAGSFDVILSDIDMPGMNGIELLKQVRAGDLDVPVVLITGDPRIDTAMKAIEQGVLRYLSKPVEPNALVEVTADAVRLHQLAKAKRQALALAGGVDRFVGDQAGLQARFDRALEGLFIAYQPIVSWSKRSVYAYEALLRSREPSLPHPGALLNAAERLNRVHELGRRIREKAVEPLSRLPDDVLLFLNLHPTDLLDEHLFATTTAVSGYAGRIVLEITERASLNETKDVQGRIATLRRLGFRIAIDDLGAGYAGLTSFTLLEPEIVKLDMGLIRNLHAEPTKLTLVRTMIAMCNELGIIVTSEGIETPDERDALERAGCDLMQGYLFAKPTDPFVTPRF
jgi:EAL domain-containing protein (putative c-di-GMP-specific phosphodiesterase class I)